MGLKTRTALVLTVSDGVSRGLREDASGAKAEEMLIASGYSVEKDLVPDDQEAIVGVLSAAVDTFDLIVTTGGTGFGPRDVTPEATLVVLEREAPGLVHLMISAGLKNTPRAALSRGRAGSAGGTLIVNLPGSPRAVEESLSALGDDLLSHIHNLLGGDTAHT